MVSPPESTEAGGRTEPDAADAPPSAAFHEAARHLRQARDFAWYYFRIRLDQIGLAIRDAIGFAAVLLTGLLMGAALLVTAIVLFCRGIAETLTALFGGREWLGDIVTAVLLLAGVVTAGHVSMKHIERLWKQRTVRVYDRLKRRQRAAHGTDVEQQSQH